jgi:APA family basic amino acid/polyamine antiporter
MPDRLRQLHPKYGTPWIGILVFGAIACIAMLPGQADFLGYMYAFGAMLSFTIAHASRHPPADHASPTAPALPRPGRPASAATTCRCSRSRRLGTGAWRSSSSRPAPQRRDRGHGWLAIGDRLLRRLPPRQGLDLTTTEGRASRAGRRARGRVRVGARRARRQALLRGRRRDRGKVAARRRRGIHVLVTIPVPRRRRSRPRCPSRSSPRRRSSSRPASRAGGASAATTRRSARPGRAHDRQRGAAMQRAGDRHAAAARGPAARCSARRSRPCSPSALPGDHPLRRRACNAEAARGGAPRPSRGGRGGRLTCAPRATCTAGDAVLSSRCS